MKKLVVALAVLPLLALLALFAPDGNSAPPADASDMVYTVVQGADWWTVVPLVGLGGALPAEGGTESVESFYGYNVPVDASTKQTGLTESGKSLLFLYEEFGPPPIHNGGSAPSVISLVIIHDRAEAYSGGKANFGFAGLPDAAAWAVWDDGPPASWSDIYTPWDPPSGSAEWEWTSWTTDGGAIQGGLEEEFCITVDPNFIDGIGEGIGNIGWEFITFPTPATPTLVWLDMQKPVTIRTPLGVCPYVGGTVELLGQSESPAGASESSARDYTAPLAAAIAAGALVVVAAGGWYVRRRRVR